jgi:hypothetical protein
MILPMIAVIFLMAMALSAGLWWGYLTGFDDGIRKWGKE